MKLDNEQLKIILGGFDAKTAGIGVLITGIIAFFSGFLDGYINPKKCNNLW